MNLWDKIQYNNRECTVIGIKEEPPIKRLKVIYTDGTIDDVKCDESRYHIIERYSSHKVVNATIDENNIEHVYVDIPTADPFIEVEYEKNTSGSYLLPLPPWNKSGVSVNKV